MSTYQNEICEWLDFSPEASSFVKGNLATLDLPSSLSGADWETLLQHLVPGWQEKGTRLKELNWPKNELADAEEIKKVPGWQEKGTRLMHKKVNYFIKVLLLAVKPTSLSDLMKHLNYSNRKTFRENYLLPLQEVQFIERTVKDLVSSPDQKYRTTEKGKRFLTGGDK